MGANVRVVRPVPVTPGLESVAVEARDRGFVVGHRAEPTVLTGAFALHWEHCVQQQCPYVEVWRRAEALQVALDLEPARRRMTPGLRRELLECVGERSDTFSLEGERLTVLGLRDVDQARTLATEWVEVLQGPVAATS